MRRTDARSSIAAWIVATMLAIAATATATAADEPPRSAGFIDEIAAIARKARAYTEYLRGRAAIDLGDDDAAIAHFDEAIRLDPGLSKAADYRFNCWIATNRYDEVIATLDEAIRRTPGEAWAYWWRGYAHREKKQYDRAIADLRASLLASDSINRERCHLLARYYAEAGRPDEARRWEAEDDANSWRDSDQAKTTARLKSILSGKPTPR